MRNADFADFTDYRETQISLMTQMASAAGYARLVSDDSREMSDNQAQPTHFSGVITHPTAALRAAVRSLLFSDL